MKVNEKYTWKTKNQILSIGSIVFMILIYQLAIKRTLNTRAAYLLQQEGLETEGTIINNINNLKQQISILSNPIDSPKMPNFFETEYLVSLAHDTKIIVRNLSEAKVIVENNRNIYYNAYYFSGSFKNLLSFLNRTEQKENINILNARFFKEKNQVTREPELVMKLETATIN